MIVNNITKKCNISSAITNKISCIFKKDILYIIKKSAV
jgi:hypothetical protein